VQDRTFLVLGGAGMVGFEVAREVAARLHPERVVLASLPTDEVQQAVDRLRRLVPPTVEVIGEWGDLFVREEFSESRRPDLMEDQDCRRAIFDDLLGPLDAAYERSCLARLLARHRPDVVVDAINTATAISYQDVYSAAVRAERDVKNLLGGDEAVPPVLARDVETLILSLSMPQLVRHVLILDRALREAGTRLYLKIGTTGTGGMGLNIPYTHSEDRPSAKLLTKTAVGFAHTGLLYLMARSPDRPVVKEIKPGALIGYADIGHRTIQHGGAPVSLYASQAEVLGTTLQLQIGPAAYERHDDLRLPVVDTGENGLFTKGEFEAITALGQMEFVTPEEIARLCVQEISGRTTGRDVVAALDGAVLGPSYRAGVLRSRVLEELRGLEEQTGTHSVALGQLGPPELSKLLWEAELLSLAFGTLPGVLAVGPGALSAGATAVLEQRPGLRDTITSLGLPVLAADGETLWRGPFLRIPEMAGSTEVPVGPGDRDRWAAKGWVDLRPASFARWQERLQAMHSARPGADQPGSAGAVAETSLSEHIQTGAVAAWVLANELGGYRVK
jgi:NAD(P)-dependent dehydrogenase (short-subunit alcohol dehydrogenase family)